MVGKEAALFVPSGTFGNQLALFTWCPRGSEVILGEQCHIIQHEAGAASIIASVQTRTVDAPNGILPLSTIEAKIRGLDIHFPPTSLICLENAHSSGMVMPLSYMAEVSALARKAGLPIHLDGARLFNAAAFLGVDAAQIAGHVDSVMFCLSKGLCAPVGSMLAGSKDFIASARRKRKPMGGGWRQAGILAAAGLIALRDMTKRLPEDHETALYLAQKLSSIPGFTVQKDILDINMVFLTLPAWVDGGEFTAWLAEAGILVNPPEGGLVRFVTHYWVGCDAVDRVAACIAAFVASHGPA